MNRPEAALCEFLGEVDLFLCAGVIGEFGKAGIPQLFVEGNGLEGERFQADAVCASMNGFSFGGGKKSLAVALAPKVIFDPDGVDVEPTQIGGSDNTADDGVLIVTQSNDQVLHSFAIGFRGVVGKQALDDGAHVGGLRFGFDDDLHGSGEWLLFSRGAPRREWPGVKGVG